jgi:nifR3 family TIM-barrel protein
LRGKTQKKVIWYNIGLMEHFWQHLPRPFTVLAPMEGVTDAVFRQVITKIGKPHVLVTEFTHTDGIMSKGRKRVMDNFLFSPNEQPIVAQIYGTNTKNFYESAKFCKELGFAGIDINMGCPVSRVIARGSCSGLINNPPLAAEIIAATQEGASGLPVSVKTRIGFGSIAIEKWIGFLLEQKLPALTVHLRTTAEMSKVPAHWELMPQIISLRDSISKNTVIIGNGDITSMDEINQKFNQYNCDGFMVGRGIFHNPWMFNPKVDISSVTVKQRIDQYIDHIHLFDKTWGNKKNPASLKKFCKTYIQNFPDASDLREKLVRVDTSKELIQILSDYKNTL